MLVRVSCELSLDQYSKITRAVKKWAGEDIRVLVVNCTQVKMLWMQKESEETKVLVSPKDAEHQAIEIGVANLSTSVIDFKSGDSLLCIVPRISSEMQRKKIHDWVHNWTGHEIEVIVQEGHVNSQ